MPHQASVRLSLGIALHALACVATAFGNPGSSSTQGGGLTVTHFGNTAMAGPGRPTVAHTLENVPTHMLRHTSAHALENTPAHNVWCLT